MTRPTIAPTGRAREFSEDEVIVSKTDLKGRITYANNVFIRVSGFSEDELLGAPHNIIRHPDMPGCVFRFLWETIAQGKEVFAYVINLAKDGGHYWVFAHVTPSYDRNGDITGYHSSRRVPYPDALPRVKALYETLLAEERKHANRSQAVDASYALLGSLLANTGLPYDEWVFGLSAHTRLEAEV